MAFKKFHLSRKRLIIIGILVVVAAVIGAYALGLFEKEKPVQQAAEPQKFYSKLTGVEVPEAVSKEPVLGVMIENSEFARPQTGLDSAGIVFEAVTEGGITRYLALYQENQPEIVGPVRSVRPHFVDWVMGFDAPIAHVGGSEQALDLISQRNAKDLTQFKFPAPYYRDSSREAPHNMYARTKDLRSLEQRLRYQTSMFADFPRSDDQPSQTPNATRITVDFSIPLFLSEFRYNAKDNNYVRYLAGEPHIDAATKKPITVKNVIVVKATGVTNGVKALGSGKALLFKDGSVQDISWENPSYKSRIKFVDSSGNEVSLNRGQTWIVAVASDHKVTYQ